MTQNEIDFGPAIDGQIERALEIQNSRPCSAARWVKAANRAARNDPEKLAEAADILGALFATFPTTRR